VQTYRQLFGTPEFTPFFLTISVQTAAQTVGGLAMATLVFAATGSPLLSALAMFGPSLAQVVGAITILSASEKMPPRGALIGLAMLLGVTSAVQAIAGLPIWAIFAILFGQGLIACMSGAVRWGLLNEIVSRDGYLLGRSVLNMANGLMQIFGFILGGVLVNILTPQGTMLVGAGLYVVAAGFARFGLRPRAPRLAGRPSIAETWSNKARLWASKPRRYVYLALWIPNGLIVGCEALYVPYAPAHAGLLFVCGAAGMIVGDVMIGRFVPRRLRRRLGAPMRLILAIPYLIFAFSLPVPLAAGAIVLASVGYAASLLLQEQLLELTPESLSSPALGLQSAGMLTMQGVGAAFAGLVAELTTPGIGMTVMGALSLIVTLALHRGLRHGPEEPGLHTGAISRVGDPLPPAAVHGPS
jgi:MFS family permease